MGRGTEHYSHEWYAEQLLKRAKYKSQTGIAVLTPPAAATTPAKRRAPAKQIDAAVTRFEIELPIRTYSEANKVEAHWSPRHRRFKAQKKQLRAEWSILAGRVTMPMPCIVTFTRLAPGTRKLDLDDNLPSAFKGLRDELAAILGVDDGQTQKIRFRYEQERSPAYGVRICIEPMKKEESDK